MSIKWRTTGRLENEKERRDPDRSRNGLKKRKTGSQRERENKVTKKCRRSRKRVVKGWQAAAGGWVPFILFLLFLLLLFLLLLLSPRFSAGRAQPPAACDSHFNSEPRGGPWFSFPMMEHHPPARPRHRLVPLPSLPSSSSSSYAAKKLSDRIREHEGARMSTMLGAAPAILAVA